MDPFLSVVASAFPGILDYKERAKPEGCYPNRPAGGTRRGPGQSYHRGRKSVFPSDNTHRRPSSAFFVFNEKTNPISISESVFLPPPPPFVEPFLVWLGKAFPYLNLAGILSSLIQIGVGLFGLNRGSNMILRS
jgi:hypothetical protein